MTLTIIASYLDTITTGTVGTTTIIGDIPNIMDGITIGVSILLLVFIGLTLDRWFNRYQGLELEDSNQDQELE